MQYIKGDNADFVKLEQLTGILQRNDLNLPADAIKTTYKNAYNNLLNQIDVVGTRLLQAQVSDIEFDTQSGLDFFAELEKREIIKNASMAIQREYDVDKFKAYCVHLRALGLQYGKQKGVA